MDSWAAARLDRRLGATGFGDMGRQYPDSDPALKGIDSRELLRDTMRRLHAEGFAGVNVDATIVAQAPHMAPHIPNMVSNIAQDLGVDPRAINVKATTTEQLGFIGRGEGIAAQAVCLVDRVSV